jgi:hypothetical protein
MSYEAGGAQPVGLHNLPQRGKQLGLQAPGFLGELHLVSRPPLRPQHECVHHMSQHRSILGVQASGLYVMLIVPPRSVYALRRLVLVMPRTDPLVE